MKSFVFSSVSLLIIIFVVFAVSAVNQKTDPAITAFNSSLTKEYDKNYQAAIDDLLSVYEANKNNYLFNLRLGWLYYLLGKYDESVGYYYKAVSNQSKSIEARLGLTYPLSAQEKWDEVKKQYELILNEDPKNYTANLRLGQYYLIRGNYSNANKYLSIAWINYPSAYEVNLSYGWTQYYLGNKAKAKELFTNTLMVSPADSLGTIGYNLVK